MHDPRWRGLKAVLDKRVYTMPGTNPGGGGLAGLIFQPLWTLDGRARPPRPPAAETPWK
jgi:hypothetical protein